MDDDADDVIDFSFSLWLAEKKMEVLLGVKLNQLNLT
jgi:hypothetical protein